MNKLILSLFAFIQVSLSAPLFHPENANVPAEKLRQKTNPLATVYLDYSCCIPSTLFEGFKSGTRGGIFRVLEDNELIENANGPEYQCSALNSNNVVDAKAPLKGCELKGNETFGPFSRKK